MFHVCVVPTRRWSYSSIGSDDYEKVLVEVTLQRICQQKYTRYISTTDDAGETIWKTWVNNVCSAHGKIQVIMVPAERYIHVNASECCQREEVLYPSSGDAIIGKIWGMQ